MSDSTTRASAALRPCEDDDCPAAKPRTHDWPDVTGIHKDPTTGGST